MRSMLVLIGLTALAVASTSHATIITVEPDDFAPGANLSNLGDGVRLSTFTNYDQSYRIGALRLSSVYSQRNPICSTDLTSCDAITGDQGFGSTAEPLGHLYGDWIFVSDAASCWDWFNTGGWGNPCGTDMFRALLMEFDRPTDFVQIAGAYLSDPPSIIAFDQDFNRLGGCGYGDGPNCYTLSEWRPSFEYNHRTVSFITETPQIKYAIAAGVSGNTSLDRLRYHRVPEPGTLALLCIGILGIGIARQRRSALALRSAPGEQNSI